MSVENLDDSRHGQGKEYPPETEQCSSGDDGKDDYSRMDFYVPGSQEGGEHIAFNGVDGDDENRDRDSRFQDLWHSERCENAGQKAGKGSIIGYESDGSGEEGDEYWVSDTDNGRTDQGEEKNQEANEEPPPEEPAEHPVDFRKKRFILVGPLFSDEALDSGNYPVPVDEDEEGKQVY